ncbi:DUF4861 family protein [Lacimicrobium alkaliphilum]|uniref:DUF4861 domain-containing protein n=1 Tax=Lacimicrobium alkaliphilum TaxID=1526571 RepID=A0ABQ1R8N5_9ALTE|nr:DUF4861 family protein [Lacimicrobium alkaliphilum]GGD60447.1 hypothetical protein GCM10011357_14640 [Lacimicrobium alkaliphilum]
MTWQFIRQTGYLAVLIVSVMLVGCKPSAETGPKVSITNPSSFDRQDEVISVSLTSLGQEGNALIHSEVMLDNGQTSIPGQWLDTDKDTQPDTLLFSVSVPAQSEVSYQLVPAQETRLSKRTYAELGVRQNAQWQEGRMTGGSFEPAQTMTLPDTHEIGDGLFKYEGPGWESDKVAYRLYFDQRNILDIFGKRRAEITLEQVGQVGAPSYHELQDWGMDVLKTGPSIGLGSVAVYEDGQTRRIDNSEKMQVSIAHNSPLYSEVHVAHSGFVSNEGEADIDTRYSIAAGTALTKVTVSVEGEAPPLVTGIVKHQQTLMRSNSQQKDGWHYVATFGPQSYINDALGMAIFYRAEDLQHLGEDQHNHLVVMKPSSKPLQYYFAGYWQQGPDGISDQAQFKAELERTLIRLNQPLQLQID